MLVVSNNVVIKTPEATTLEQYNGFFLATVKQNKISNFYQIFCLIVKKCFFLAVVKHHKYNTRNRTTAFFAVFEHLTINNLLIFNCSPTPEKSLKSFSPTPEKN